MRTQANRLWVEFAVLYFGLPLGLLALRRAGVTVPVLPLLWVASGLAAGCLGKRYGWRAKEFLGCPLSRRLLRLLAVRGCAAAVLLCSGILWVAPSRLLELPRHDFRLWGCVMVAYPVLSVYPQGLLYRGLFYARYACLFGNERQRWLVASVIFGLAHLLFANVWAVGLAFAGGLLLNATYRRTGSMGASDLEHALYGQLVFTSGWGRSLYQGTLRFVEEAIR